MTANSGTEFEPFDYINWREKYARKKEIRPEDIEDKIKRGSRIFIGSGCSEPLILTNQLNKKQWRIQDCEIIHFLTVSENKFFNDKDPSLFRHQALFIGAAIRDAVNQGKADYIPISLSDIPKMLNAGRLHIDVALVQVSPPDRFGFCSLGISVDINRTVINTAKIVIAQINPQMPVTMGDSFIGFDTIDYYVYNDAPLLEFHYPPLDDLSDKIGTHVARLVENGSTLQFGIGTIPNAVIKHLKDKKDLAIYSEVLSDSVIPLIKNGVVTCAKNRWPHIMTSFVMGSKELYDFVNLNPFIEFHSTEFINNIFNIAQNTKQISINAALTVSITGQVNSDSIAESFYSGIGGQSDFARGAALSEGGKPIICLPSITGDGTKSRIVAVLEPGAGVVIPRHDTHYVVTEWGVAYLHGKSIRERVLQMIGIAHPKFRLELLQKAKELNYIYEDQILPMTKNGVVVVYPDKYEYYFQTHSKGEIFFRPIKPTDERLLQDLYYQLDDSDRILRFFAPRQAFPHKETLPKVNVDYETTMMIVGIEGKEEHEHIVAAGSYFLDHATNMGEIAFTVTKDYRNQGLTKYMMMKLVEIAQEKGIDGFVGEVLAENSAMLHIFRTVPFDTQFSNYGDSFEFSFKFASRKEKG